MLLLVLGRQRLHHLVDALDFLGLAIGHALSIEATTDLDLVTTTSHERSLDFQEIWNDPRLGLELEKASFENYLVRVGRLTSLSRLFIFILSEHNFKEEAKNLSRLLGVGE